MGDTEYVEVEVHCIADTPDAILIVPADKYFADQRKIREMHKHWIPRSQLGCRWPVHEKGDSGSMEIPEWMAVKEGLV